MCLWPQTACPSDPDCRLAGAGQGKKGGLPASLSELHRLLARALKKTEALWPTLEKAYALVHQAAHVLANHENESGQAVRERYESVLSTMREQQASLGALGEAISTFLKVTESYWPGLFHCYDLAAWYTMREQLTFRREARRKQLRFRKDPAAYLAALEDILLKIGLPS